MLSTKFALSHRTTVFVLAFLIVIVGMVSYLSLPREAAPDIKFPYIIVSTIYPGVSPEDIENLVTNRLESKFEDLTDLDEMTSTSSEGMSVVVLKFMPDVNSSEALQQVRDRVNRAQTEMPNEIEDPDVREISSSDWPILMVNISGTAGLVRLKRIAEDLKTDIEAMKGVLEVDISGGLEREIRVEVNPHSLQAYGLSLNDVVNALAMENVNIPGGPIKEGDLRYTLRIPEEITDPNQIKNMVVSTKAGHPIRVKEIAEVVDDFKEKSTVSRYRQVEGVTLTVKKESGANIIEVVDGVKEYIDGASKTFPSGTKVTYLSDFSKRIRDMIRELENNIITALILVMLVLFMFIGGRNAFFVALAVPLSMLVSFTVLSIMGITLNMVVLFGLILALGMLVDNAIVIVENIYRHAHMDKTLLQAAHDGTTEVGWPVITSTLTTLSVFFPLLAWPGIMGEFMSYLPLTLIITLTSSLFVALIINPVIASVFMKVKKNGESGDEDEQSKAPKYGVFVGGYRKALGFSLRHPVVILLIALVTLAGSMALFILSKPQVEFFPSTTPERMKVNIQAPEGTRLEATDRITMQVESALADVDNAKHFLSEVGTGGGVGQSQTHRAIVSVDFQDRQDWTESPFQTIENLREAISVIPGAQIRVEKQQNGPPRSAPINIELAGDDYDVLSQAAETVKSRINEVKGLTDLRDDFDSGRPELLLLFNRTLSNKLILNGLRVVAGSVRTAIYGTTATLYRMGEEEYDVTVRLQDKYRTNREDVLALTVAGKEGRQIPLSQVVKMDSTVGTSSIKHIDRNRVITVSAEAEGRPGAEVLKDVRKILKDFNPRGATVSFTGENEDMQESQQFMGQALLIGIFLMAMVLLTQFNSVGQLVIILFSVVLSMVGVFIGLTINKMPFSVMMTGVGIISLAGVVVNNAIVLIDYINKLRRDGHELTEAIIEAGTVRLRPILLTAGTTILGLLPMAQGFDFDVRTMHVETGTGSMEFWGPMAIAVIYGLSFATLLTTIVVPVLYHALERLKVASLAFMERHLWFKRIAILLGLVFITFMAYSLIVGIAG